MECFVVREGYRIMCIYASNKCSERECFFLEFSQFLETVRSVLLLKDFNFVR